MYAAKFYVPSEYSTIRQAINNVSNGDSIIVSKGTYTGDGNEFQFSGKSIYLMSEAGPDSTIILNNAFRFLSGNNSAIVVDGFTITCNPIFKSNYVFFMEYSSPIIRNCIFKNINIDSAPLIHGIYSSAKIENCRFIQNTIANGSSLVIFQLQGAPVITGCQFSNNNALGQIIYLVNCDSAKIFKTELVGNTRGDAIVAASRNTKIENCKILRNQRGITLGSPNAEIRNCLVAENFDYGIKAGSESVKIINCTIAGNSGYGMHFPNFSSSNSVITNSIFFENGKNEIYSNSNIHLLISYSCIDKEDVADLKSSITWGFGNIDQNPMFADAANSDYHLTESSGCLNAGNSKDFPLTDLNGNIRPLPVATNPDMGCYEFNQSTNGIEYSEKLIGYVYPNPTNGTLFIVTDNSTNLPILRIYNYLGVQVLNYVLEESNKELDLSGFPNGMYFVDLWNGEKGNTFKVVKN
jgi:hypothetical protein